MKVIIACLTYGNRPKDILYQNMVTAHYPAIFIEINREGIANALNDALDSATDYGADAVGFLANDIIEPEAWLAQKVEWLQDLHGAGIVSTSVNGIPANATNQHIIGNWLMKTDVFKKVGYFWESQWLYSPIDLDYCERAWMGGFNTFYVPGIKAEHLGDHAQGSEYGYDKNEMIKNSWPTYLENINGYRSGQKDIYKGRL